MDAARRESRSISRRDFMRVAAAAGGLALTLELRAQEGVPFAPRRAGPPRPPSAFLHIAEDDAITITTPAVEIGCGKGLCGACSVLLDGQVTRSCLLQVGVLAGQSIVTIEGLSKDKSHPVQRAWIEESVPQCG